MRKTITENSYFKPATAKVELTLIDREEAIKIIDPRYPNDLYRTYQLTDYPYIYVYGKHAGWASTDWHGNRYSVSGKRWFALNTKTNHVYTTRGKGEATMQDALRIVFNMHKLWVKA